jgi:F0F1-type ATP synthase assembly protein I
MNRATYVIGTMLAAGVLGIVVGAIWGFFAQETGWWGAGMLLGLILGIVFGVSVAERAAA